ncbi:conserved Plasmodium protein, unknown function [Plasmodium relictum]|uniref:Uncharacterized protein n=1 Tax=Plasmodium relictum TaxID=85471 RepID=A0A1J1HAR0_PLARL|nr:conserved Plasmodium protein, unknown function [Plasmodium relictum]CRH02483.1 conserved Plasmodium protein, unknown function [Plasmodium relictum]
MTNNHTSVFLFTVQGILASLTCGLCCFIYAYCYNNKLLKNENKNFENKNKRNISKLKINTNDCSNYKKRNIEKECKDEIYIKDSLNKKINENEIINNEQSLFKNGIIENDAIPLKNKLKNRNNILCENRSLKNNKNSEDNSFSENTYNKIDNEKLICDKKNLINGENDSNKIILCKMNHYGLSPNDMKFKEFNDISLNTNISNNFQINYDKNENKNSNLFLDKNYAYISFNEEERKKYFSVANDINKKYLCNKLYSYENNKDENVVNLSFEKNADIGNTLNINKKNSCILTNDNNTCINKLNNHIISNSNNNNNNNNNNNSCSNVIEYNTNFDAIEKDEFCNTNKDIEKKLYLSKHKEKFYNDTLKDNLHIKDETNLTNKCNEKINHYQNEFFQKINSEKYQGKNYYNSPKENKNYTKEFENCEKKNNEMNFKGYENIDNLFSTNNLNYFDDISTLTKYDENITIKNYKDKPLLDASKAYISVINKQENVDNFITYQNKNNTNNSDPLKYSIKNSNISSTSNTCSKDNPELDYIYSLNNCSNKTNNGNTSLKDTVYLYKDIDNSNNNNSNNSRNFFYSNSNTNSCYNTFKIKDLNIYSHMHSNFINFDKTNKVQQHKLMYNYNEKDLLKSKRKTSLPPLNDFINEQNDISVENYFEIAKKENDKNNNMLYIDENKCTGKHNDSNSSFELGKKEKFKNIIFNEQLIHNLSDFKKNLLCDIKKKYIHNNSNIKNNLILHSDNGNEYINKNVEENICISDYKNDNYLPNFDIKKMKSNEKFKNSNNIICNKMNSINDYISLYNSNCNSYEKFKNMSRNKYELQEKEYMKNKENNDFYFLTDENIDESLEKKSFFNEINSKNNTKEKVSPLNNITTQEKRELHFKKYDINLPVASLNYSETTNYEHGAVKYSKNVFTNKTEEEKENELNILRKEEYQRDLKKKEIDECKKNNEIKEIVYAYLQNSKNEYNLKNSNKCDEDIEKIEEYNQDKNISMKTIKNESNKKKQENKNINNCLKINLNDDKKSDEKSNCAENSVNNKEVKSKNYYTENKKDDSFEKSTFEKEKVVKGEKYEKNYFTYENDKNNNDIYLKNEKRNSNISVKKEQKKDMNLMREHLKSTRVRNERSKKWNPKFEDDECSISKKKAKKQCKNINNRTIKKEEILQKKKKISKTQPMELKVIKEQTFLNYRDKLKMLCQKYNTIDENRCASGFANFLMQHIQKTEDMENFDNLLNFTLKLKNTYEMKTTDFIEAFLILETIDLSVIRMYPIKEWILVTFHYLKGSLTDKNLKTLIKSLKLDNLIISNVTACFYMNKKHIKITEEDIKRILTILSDVVIRRSSRIKKSKNSYYRNKSREKQNKDEILGSCWHPVNKNITIYKK